MSAQELRQAAALIRERAEAATPGPWHPATTGEECGDHWSVLEYPTMTTVARIPSDDGSNDDQRCPDAKHIASWGPTRAVLVADLLDVTAVHIENHDCEAHCEPRGCGLVLSALNLARAYLGSES